jgi:hypothetical protein
MQAIARRLGGTLLLAVTLASCGAGARSDEVRGPAPTATPQAITVSGTVRSNLTLAGLRAKITGAAKAETDANGGFSVQVPNATSALVVSAPGYEKARIKATRSRLTVTLNADPRHHRSPGDEVGGPAAVRPGLEARSS